MKKLIFMLLLVCSVFCTCSAAGKLSSDNPELLNYIRNHSYDYVYKYNSNAGTGVFAIIDLKSVVIEWSNEHETVIHADTIPCSCPYEDKIYFRKTIHERFAYNHDERNMYIEVTDKNTGATTWKYLPPTKGGNKHQCLAERDSSAAEQVYYLATRKKFHVNSPYDYHDTRGVGRWFR